MYKKYSSIFIILFAFSVILFGCSSTINSDGETVTLINGSNSSNSYYQDESTGCVYFKAGVGKYSKLSALFNEDGNVLGCNNTVTDSDNGFIDTNKIKSLNDKGFDLQQDERTNCYYIKVGIGEYSTMSEYYDENSKVKGCKNIKS